MITETRGVGASDVADIGAEAITRTCECSRRRRRWKAHVAAARDDLHDAQAGDFVAQRIRACQSPHKPLDPSRAYRTATLARRAGDALPLLAAQRVRLAGAAPPPLRRHDRT